MVSLLYFFGQPTPNPPTQYLSFCNLLPLSQNAAFHPSPSSPKSAFPLTAASRDPPYGYGLPPSIILHPLSLFLCSTYPIQDPLYRSITSWAASTASTGLSLVFSVMELIC